MKKLIHNILRVALVVLVFGLSSCQEEFEKIGDDPQSETIAANSTTAVLIENTSSNDGSYDNIVDGASCLAIQFPYTVNVNGVEVTIDSESDLDVVEEIFDELDDDDDILDIVFPITITLSDFSEITIENQDELETFAKECLEGGDDDDIECVDFVYPITLFTFDVQNQVTGDFEIGSDMDMRRFFDELEDDDLISIEFPITLKKYDGTEVTVQNNAELAAALEMAKNQCDEDDDDDYNDDDFSESELDEYLMACPLQVREVIRNEVDNTEQYIERLMTFNEDGTVYFSTFTADEIMGTWSTSMSDNGVMLSLDFENFPDFTIDARVYELDDDKIKLYKDDGNKIVLKKRCDLEDSANIDREAFIALIKECEWVIKEVENQGEEIERLLGYEFQFMTDGVVTLGNGVNTTEGTWEIGLNSQYQLSLMITMGDEPGVSFEWPIKEMTETRLNFSIEETDHEMVLLKVCDDSVDDGDVAEIRNIAMGGPWNVALYQEGEMDMTTSYTGMDFDFSTMYQVEVSINADPIANGLWRVLRDSDDGLKFYINFDTGDDLAELTEDWKVVSITSTRIELKDENDDGSVDTLVFEKP
ncbi:hypothetical protein D2V08_04085 [Flagellimonas lutimaris]|uniref:Lipocalin-like domain-containing protein n=1 Tax=Flagellimonas lutimaris TaxID=475082 RepID=A0A3A1NCD7_9FLAO|nr:hypothetical protein [Allomuricauda lutimaris]RIV35809.1 hypothetical protein D2V08_04085 [Allomuricauda lutimaris]